MASVVAMIGSYILLLLVIGFLASAVLKLGPRERRERSKRIDSRYFRDIAGDSRN